MRTVGLLGGMSAESTTLYYQAMNRLVRERLGGLHSMQLLMWSVDFAPIAQMQADGDWEAAGDVLAQAAARLEGAGAWSGRHVRTARLGSGQLPWRVWRRRQGVDGCNPARRPTKVCHRSGARTGLRLMALS